MWISKKELEKKLRDAQLDYANTAFDKRIDRQRWDTVFEMQAEIKQLKKKLDKMDKIIREGY